MCRAGDDGGGRRGSEASKRDGSPMGGSMPISSTALGPDVPRISWMAPPRRSWKSLILLPPKASPLAEPPWRGITSPSGTRRLPILRTLRKLVMPRSGFRQTSDPVGYMSENGAGTSSAAGPLDMKRCNLISQSLPAARLMLLAGCSPPTMAQSASHSSGEPARATSLIADLTASNRSVLHHVPH